MRVTCDRPHLSVDELQTKQVQNSLTNTLFCRDCAARDWTHYHHRGGTQSLRVLVPTIVARFLSARRVVSFASLSELEWMVTDVAWLANQLAAVFLVRLFARLYGESNLGQQRTKDEG